MDLVVKNIRICEVTQDNYLKGGDEWAMNIILTSWLGGDEASMNSSV